MPAAYVFVRTGTSWSQQAYLKASNTDAQDHFGRSLALSADGDTLAFVVAADRFALPDTLAVRAGLDALAADLAQCHCSAQPGSGG